MTQPPLFVQNRVQHRFVINPQVSCRADGTMLVGTFFFIVPASSNFAFPPYLHLSSHEVGSC